MVTVSEKKKKTHAVLWLNTYLKDNQEQWIYKKECLQKHFL